MTCETAERAQRRRPRGAPIATATARRRSLQRLAASFCCHFKIYSGRLVGHNNRFGIRAAPGMKNLQAVSAWGHSPNFELTLLVGHSEVGVSKHANAGIVPRMQVALEAVSYTHLRAH